ncbi:MAG: DUF1223 domain-containing protein [Allosphingosinicella sp.]
MPNIARGLSLAIALSASAGLWSGTLASAADSDHPVVVELFQSQGCSSCPPANAILNQIADRPEILALSFAVTYWDQLGWKDSFAHPAYTARQWEYSRAGGRGNVSTPQMIVNGRGVLVGSDRNEVAAFIRRFDRGVGGPAIAVAGGQVRVAQGKASRPANVWLIRYDPRIQNVPIRAGENGGRTLPHKNIVRSVQLLGKWTGKAASFAMTPSGSPFYRTAVLVQDGPGGAILSARKL